MSDVIVAGDSASAAANDEGSGTAATGRPRSGRRLVIATITLPALAYGILGWIHRWTSDDGFIFFRVVDNVVHGYGPVFNPGERVEAATSPLWVGILSVVRLVLPGSVRLEYLALWLSLLAAVFGVVAASLGALRVVRAAPARSARSVVVPFGALVVVAIAAFWDFATSGLEMGLVFAWLGACFWASMGFVQSDARGRARRRWWLAVLLGLGVLIRPDLAVFSVAFLVAQVVVDTGTRWLLRLGAVAAGVGLPVAYELFRMGYYAALVPNSALAKSPAGAQWSHGFSYLENLVSSYFLELPLVLLAAVLVVVATRLRRAGAHGEVVVVAAPLAAGLVHALYVVQVGGDFFHARLLLPALFAFAMPVAVVAVSDTMFAAAAVVMAGWALVCGIALRPLSSDQRAFYARLTGHAHPVTLSDYRHTDGVRDGIAARRSAASGSRVLVIPSLTTFYIGSDHHAIVDLGRQLALRADVQETTGLAWTAIGALGYEAGPHVFVLDRLGLGDPIGSRLSGFPSYFPVGHQRYMSLPWVEARLAAPDAHDPDPTVQAFREAAAHALRCGDVAELMRAVRAPLSAHRFMTNVFDSFSLSTLRITQNPVQASLKYCR